MENIYNPAEIESKWQQSWTDANLYKTDTIQQRDYVIKKSLKIFEQQN